MQSYTQLHVYILLSNSEFPSAWLGSYSCSVYRAQMKHTTLFPSPYAQNHTLFLLSAKNIFHETLPIKSQTTPVAWHGHQTSLCLFLIGTASTTGWVKMLLPYDLAGADIVWSVRNTPMLFRETSSVVRTLKRPQTPRPLLEKSKGQRA